MKKKTLKQSVTLEGIGLHSGIDSKITIKPAEIGKGIRFIRMDLEDNAEIIADVSNIYSTQRCTILGKEKYSVGTVEHLLASFYALGITDVLVEVYGPEIPVLDGSAKDFIEALKDQVLESEIDAEVFQITEPIYFRDHDSGAEYYLFPSENLQVSAIIEMGNEEWSDQAAELKILEEFENEISPARTFCFVKDLLGLKSKGLIQGGSLENALVLAEKPYTEKELSEFSKELGIDTLFQSGNKVINKEGMRFPNEPARHKILDILGDISLTGFHFRGKIIAKKPGHGGNCALARHLKKEYIEFRKLKNKPIYDPDAEPIMDLEAVKHLLPHRYPFLLVDKIISLSENVVVGVKSITFNENFFQGHFPGNPVFPGVLQMEALAQTGGILALSNVEDPQNWDTYFLKMDNVKFKNKVVPGDTLILKMELLSPIRRGIVHMQGTAYVGKKIVSEGELIAQIIKRK